MGMSDGPGEITSEALPHELNNLGGHRWSLMGNGVQRQRAVENTTLTALLLLLLVAADDREKFPASGRVIDLISALQEQRDGASGDVGLQASIISRLSTALASLRRDLE